MENVKGICFFCGKVDYKGIIVNGERICRECEQNIVNNSVAHKEYDEVKDKIKIILYK